MKFLTLGSLAVAALVLVGCASAQEQALLQAVPTSRADLVQIPGLVREPLAVTVTLPDGTLAQLEGSAVRPDLPGRFPLVLISHGTSSEWSDRQQVSAAQYVAESVAFARRGWAAVTVVRPGFGRSTGPFLEDVGPCDNRDFVAAGRRMGGEVLTILQALRQQNLSWLDNTRVLLVGQSGGGLASLAAAAAHPATVLGVLNFAGGDGAPIQGNSFCQPERLIQAMAVFGKAVRIPSLWVYAANDTRFPPKLAAAMFDAYKGDGAPAKMIPVAAYGDEGHNYIDAVDQWRPLVDSFLMAQHLPATPDRQESVAYLDPPPALQSANGQSFFSQYLRLSTYEKAYAVGSNGGAGYADGYRTIGAAKMIALQLCERRDSGCHIYAIGDRLAP
jgi:pimeloyl-ACP methyl ester carboxylesterase